MTEADKPIIRVHAIDLRMSMAYLIPGPDGNILVDAGLPGQAGIILRYMRRVNDRPLRLIFLTHAHLDHYGSAHELRTRTGAPLAMHAGDVVAAARGQSPLGTVRGRGRLVKWLYPWLRRLIPIPATVIDLVLGDGDELEYAGLTLRVMHTPGHTPGSASLWLPGGNVFVGDLMSSYGGAHIQRFFADNWDAIGVSVQRVLAGKPQRVYTGHGRKAITPAELDRFVAGANL